MMKSCDEVTEKRDCVAAEFTFGDYNDSAFELLNPEDDIKATSKKCNEAEIGVGTMEVSGKEKET